MGGSIEVEQQKEDRMTREELLEYFGEEFLVAILAVRNHYMATMSSKPSDEEIRLFRYWLRVDHLVDLLLAAFDDRNESTS